MGNLGTNEISPPSQTLLDTVSSLLGGKTLDQIRYDSSCYFYRKETDETLPGHFLFIDTRDEVNPDSMRIIVDAQKGTILQQVPLMIPARQREIYDLAGGTTRPGSPSRSEGDLPVGVAEVNNGYVSSGLTYDLFNIRFERDSWNGMGADIIVEMRYGDENVNQAWWRPGNFVRIGGGNWGWDEAFDFMAHEFSHGVANEEKLDYDVLEENSALHESFGDCMAAIFDYDNNEPVLDIWAIGEDLIPFGAVRQLDDPASSGEADYYDEVNVNGGAHHNSGVPSLAFALASKGGAHPDPSESTIVVTALGIADAAEILYEALAGYYVPSETMHQAAEHQTLAALNDFGDQEGCSFASAWHAVGVNEAFWHNPNSGSAVSYMGNVFYGSGTTFWLPGGGGRWYSRLAGSTYVPSTGAMNIWSYDTSSWYWTSAEVFPSYWDYTTGLWDLFNGIYL